MQQTNMNTKTHSHKMQMLMGAGALVALLALSACVAAPAAPTAPAAVTFKGADFSFEGPEQIAAGLTTINFQNIGKEWHHIQFARLNDGVTFQQLGETMQKDENAAMGMVNLVGGVGALDPNGSGSVTLNLKEGQYALLCFIPSMDGMPHLAKGMVRPLTVKGAGATVAEPKADVTVNLKDFQFNLPAEIKAGKQVWKVINDGPQPHEMVLMRLADGKTLEDATAWYAKPEGPQPFSMVGGMQAMNSGPVAGYINLDLQPGNYVATCDVPDPASGKPHSELGMAMPFTVK